MEAPIPPSPQGKSEARERPEKGAWSTSLTARCTLVILLSWAPLVFAVLFGGDDRVSWLVTSIFLSLVVAIFGGIFVTRRLDRSLERLERATERFARGELDVKVYPSRIPQLAHLARGLNAMGSQLKERVDALVRLSNEQDAILESMIEGVITIDRSERIMRVNEAGLNLLGISTRAVEGRLVAEVVHHADLQRFIRNAVSSDVPMMDTISVRLSGERFLEVYSTPLVIAGRDIFGTLIVFHDVTKVKRLENVRRDFVANVSHELKTPITSIKGAVETLLDGALEDPETGRKFLGMAARHADRLNAIFTDLLMLARLEVEGEDARVEVAAMGLEPILSSAIETCANLARAKNVSLSLEPVKGLRVSVNPSLFEQAVVNLLENAVKYTENGGSVTLAAEQDDGLAAISVTDTGCGIEKAHLPRLFERFYRIDQGRSRKMGGTGLGLAIVKHIAQVHGGRVEVTSTVGRGSTFTLFVPVAR